LIAEYIRPRQPRAKSCE